ncbi:hypothetical protein PC41400_00285 [Paenibacillus chitinolyticus]|uniref:Uncharacterized protein n=1 Tax=Paenibacillus chitinolyticus TaxID=79263 RepID=A0A410WPI2_9BACL|nr:hypothetical protein PC41400_00285 [Paenibacillus chitinolyticus]
MIDVGHIRKTYDIDVKHRAFAMFLEAGLGYKTVAKRLMKEWKEDGGNCKGDKRKAASNIAADE